MRRPPPGDQRLATPLPARFVDGDRFATDVLAGPIAAGLSDSDLARLTDLLATIAHQAPDDEPDEQLGVNRSTVRPFELATPETVLPLYVASEDEREVITLAQEISRGQTAARAAGDAELSRDYALASMLLVEMIARDSRCGEADRANAMSWLVQGLSESEQAGDVLIARMREVLRAGADQADSIFEQAVRRRSERRQR